MQPMQATNETLDLSQMDLNQPTVDPASVAKGALAGAVAGVAGAMAMAAVVNGLARFGPDGVGEQAEAMKEQMQQARAAFAQRAAGAVADREIPPNAEPAASMAVHLATGALGGAIYGAAAEIDDRVTLGHGLAFGAAFWVGSRVVALPALGMAPPVTQGSPKDEAKGVAMHLLYGLVAETVREPVRKAMG